MKKTLLLTGLLTTFAFAEVNKSTIACQDTKSLENVTSQIASKQPSMSDIYNLLIQNNCEILKPKERIQIVGDVIDNKFLQINVIDKNSYLYIMKSNVNNINADKNRLKKSF